jgi:hypothetical protein
MDLLELVAHFDIISRIGGWVSTFLRADWKRARERGLLAGVAAEAGHCLTRSNAPLIHFVRNAGWTGIEVERLLKQYGVPVFDRNFTGETLCFRVPLRQANWADYLLRRAGVPVVTMPISPSNISVWEHYQGEMPPLWSGETPPQYTKMTEGQPARSPRRSRRSQGDDGVGRVLDRVTSMLERVAG